MRALCRISVTAGLAALLALLASPCGAAALQPATATTALERSVCGPELLGLVPGRPDGAPTGREFARSVRDLSGAARDERVAAQVMAGNIPSFLRRLVPVTLRAASGGSSTAVTVCVLPDYLAVGSDTDFLFVPMGLKAALAVARRFGATLPTPKLVDAIYAASAVKLDPQPLTPGDRMRSTAYVLYHTELIALQRLLHPEPPGTLTAGDKKDLVIDERLWRNPGRVAIYGWHRALDRPIQPLSTVHGERYADYSHGVRLVSLTVYVDGAKRRIADVLADRELAPLLSREGPMPQLTERLEALEARPGT